MKWTIWLRLLVILVSVGTLICGGYCESIHRLVLGLVLAIVGIVGIVLGTGAEDIRIHPL